MKKKLMTFAVALGLSLAVLTGCGKKPTVESLVDGMFDDEMESLTMKTEANIKLSATIQGDSADISMGLDSDMKISGIDGKDDLIYYSDSKMTAAVGSMGKESMEFEGYVIMNDGLSTSYLYVENSDAWHKMETDIDKSDYLSYIDEYKEAWMDALKENGELAKDTEKVEGEECYVITATIKDDDLSEFLKLAQTNFEDQMETYGDIYEEIVKMCEEEGINLDIDWSAFSEYIAVDITCYISEDTGYPVKIEVDASDTDLYGLVEQIVKDTGLDKYDIMDEIEELSLSKLYYSVVISDINDTEVEIPDDVIDNAIDLTDEFNNFMGGIGGVPVDPDPIDPDPVDPDPIDPDPNEYGEEYHTLNKCDESSEKLVDVCVGGSWSYDSVYSYDEVYMYLDHKDGGYIYISNEAPDPLYSCAAAYVMGKSVDASDIEYFEENGYLDYECDFEVIGSAFGRSDLILANESYTYDNGSTRSDEECTYLLIRYDDGGLIEFLMVDFYNKSTAGWRDADFEDLAQELFGR